MWKRNNEDIGHTGDAVLGVFSDCVPDKKRSNQARLDSAHGPDSKQLFAGGACRVNLGPAVAHDGIRVRRP